MIVSERVMIAGANRVLRGGSWNNNGRNVRSANRNRNEPDNRDDYIGFRLSLAHACVDATFDQVIILSAAHWRTGKKQMPFGMLVGMPPNACRSGDFKEITHATRQNRGTSRRFIFPQPIPHAVGR
jgi:DNA-binding cell septation regulator SpoVG